MSGIAGTPGYWPPEMLRKESYNKMVDFWTLGVVLVEFLTGICPFRSKQALAFGKEKGESDKLLCCNLAVMEMDYKYDPGEHQRVEKRRSENVLFGLTDWWC